MRFARPTRYVGTPEPMMHHERYHCEKYIKRNKASLIRAGRYLVDTKALLALFHLDCGHCRQVHRETCCEGGQPYAVDDWQVTLLEQELPAIASYAQDARVREKMTAKDVWDQNAGTIRMQHGNCLFYQELSAGSFGCAIHAYAEKTGRELEPLKPFSCQLYPLDLIETDQGILVTAVTQETSSFSRWGTDYLDNFYCASPERRKQAVHLEEQLFSLSGYRPAYLWNLALLRYVLQDEADRIEALLQEMDEQRAASTC